jgi:hypothetical protein
MRRLAALATLLCSCASPPEPGEWGTFRYFGQVRGEVPLNLLPPISDRAGNAYVLYGPGTPTPATATVEARLFVGHAGGGWSGGCEIVGGTTQGVHGWVGRAEDRAWYWIGDALVQADGCCGGCTQVLEHDPASGAALRFVAIVPWVRETPSRTTTVAWVQALTDPRPFQVVVDLDNEVYVDAVEVGPRTGTNFTVLGVGGRLAEDEGVIVYRYERNGATRTVARFVDHRGEVLDDTTLSGLDALPEYGILGTIVGTATGLYAGLDSEGMLVTFDRSGGGRAAVSGIQPIGVHVWNDELWLVGTDGARPLVAAIDDDGDVGNVSRWEASDDAHDALRGGIDVLDDRSLPSREVSWSGVRSAVGPFPFLSPHSPERYASDTTTWLVAGPDFSAGGETRTAVAYAPVGVTYE